MQRSLILSTLAFTLLFCACGNTKYKKGNLFVNNDPKIGDLFGSDKSTSPNIAIEPNPGSNGIGNKPEQQGTDDTMMHSLLNDLLAQAGAKKHFKLVNVPFATLKAQNSLAVDLIFRTDNPLAWIFNNSMGTRFARRTEPNSVCTTVESDSGRQLAEISCYNNITQFIVSFSELSKDTTIAISDTNPYGLTDLSTMAAADKYCVNRKFAAGIVNEHDGDQQKVVHISCIPKAGLTVGRGISINAIAEMAAIVNSSEHRDHILSIASSAPYMLPLLAGSTIKRACNKAGFESGAVTSIYQQDGLWLFNAICAAR